MARALLASLARLKPLRKAAVGDAVPPRSGYLEKARKAAKMAMTPPHLSRTPRGVEQGAKLLGLN